MSFDAPLWAMKDAPVVDVEEWAVLVCMAEHADDDGCTAMPSQSTIAARTKLSVPTVKRRVALMAERGVIARGDQSAALIYPADRRPVVWDLMIPYSWFPNIDRIQEYRRGKGRPPITAASRPDLGRAPEKKRRVDLGVVRSDRSSRPTVLEDPRVLESDGSACTERGVLQSTTGGLVDPQPSPLTLPKDLPLDDATPDTLPLGLADSPSRQAKTAPKRPGGKTSAPDDIEITKDMRAWASDRNLTVDLDAATEEFLNHHRANGNTFQDWVAAWRTWMLRTRTYGGPQAGAGGVVAVPSGPRSRQQAEQAATNEIFDAAMARARMRDAAEAAALQEARHG